KLEFLKNDFTVITTLFVVLSVLSLHWDCGRATSLAASLYTVSFTQIKNTGSSGTARGVFFTLGNADVGGGG
ncbi:MAG: hypothetical protein AAGC93_31740, partial [Cyanobacteria bacterium P01_F01_bin.53]